MRPGRRDWAPTVTLLVGIALAVAGAGMLGYSLLQPSRAAAHQPATSPHSSCWFGDFPYYPGSLAVAASTPGADAWHVYAPAEEVANYFANGASQLAWQFQLVSTTPDQWNYRMSRKPACEGSFFVRADPAGGTIFQATPGAIPPTLAPTLRSP